MPVGEKNLQLEENSTFGSVRAFPTLHPVGEPRARLECNVIRRDFDPLYRSPDKNTQLPSIAPLYISGSKSEKVQVPSVTLTHLKRESSKEYDTKESAERDWLTLDCICLQDGVPAVLQQIAIVKERGMKNCTSSSLFFMSPIADYMTTTAKSIKVVVSKDYT
ncbi:hypothetical protein ANCCAN_13764 [Ancylostoma caninum]|uniref:Uncharacterized protein n=1 Tax=Ancylostoma caninum TaxID=29170 RepID=A0A368GAJ2_ANCCA|nr:hypothetical protein ANCCAN_13764 [Ancylostoma caninum]